MRDDNGVRKIKTVPIRFKIEIVFKVSFEDSDTHIQFLLSFPGLLMAFWNYFVLSAFE